jgi:Cdc6-like AAA superfamily ATPase
MNADTVLDDSAPLQNQYVPSRFVDRDNALQAIQDFLDAGSADRNLALHGSPGTGKTHLTLAQIHASDSNTCYIPGQRCRTQYQALKQLCQAVSNQQITDGFHTSDLKRRINEKTEAVTIRVIIDDVDFLLLNDGNDLLYYLSRTSNISILTTTSSKKSLKNRLEERTHSSLQPRQLHLEPYTDEQLQQILLTRAQDSLKQQSLHRQALTYLASKTQNPGYALTWLKTTAENTSSRITEEDVRQHENQARQRSIENRLTPFTQHHQLLYQATEELIQETENETVNTGAIYNRYQDLCQTYEEDSLSNRRISDYLKHLELLHLIQAEYHYGGHKGKTREITLAI